MPDQGPGAGEARRPIGEIFVELGFVSRAELESALEVQRTAGGRIGEILVEQGQPDAHRSCERARRALGAAPVRRGRREPRGVAAWHLRSATEQTVALESIDRTVTELGRSLAGLSSDRAADALAVGARFASAEAAIAELEARLQAQLDEAAASQRRFEEAQEELHVETGSLAGRLDELFGLRHADAQVARVANERLAARFDELAASQSDEESLVRLEAEVAELTRRIEQIDSIGEESARVIERAVLAGLADLGQQLTAKATKHGKPSKRLRRSIEALAVAIAAADARLSEPKPERND